MMGEKFNGLGDIAFLSATRIAFKAFPMLVAHCEVHSNSKEYKERPSFLLRRGAFILTSKP